MRRRDDLHLSDFFTIIDADFGFAHRHAGTGNRKRDGNSLSGKDKFLWNGDPWSIWHQNCFPARDALVETLAQCTGNSCVKSIRLRGVES